jgi:hypothetical protein
MSLSESILAANDVRVEKMPVPEWGLDVYVRTISGTEREEFEESYSEKKMKAFRVRFLVLTLCDESGERLFADKDVAALGSKSSVVINRLFEKAWGINALSSVAVDDAGNA